MELTLMVFVLVNHLSFLTTPFLPPRFSNFRRRHANPQEEDERHTASSSIPMCPLESGVLFLSAFWSCRPLSLARHLAALSLPRSPRRQGEHPLGTYRSGRRAGEIPSR